MFETRQGGRISRFTTVATCACSREERADRLMDGRFTSGDLHYTPRYFWGPGDLLPQTDLHLPGSGATDLLQRILRRVVVRCAVGEGALHLSTDVDPG